MTRYLLLGTLAVGILIGACMHNVPSMPSMPGIAVLEAQSFPAVVHAGVNPNPAADNVTEYDFAWNGGTAVAVTNLTIDPTCACIRSLPFTVQAQGPVTVRVTATNQWGTSPALVITVNVSGPGTPSGGFIKLGS